MPDASPSTSEPPPAAIVIPLLSQPDAWLERDVRSALDQTVPCDVIVVYSAATPESNLTLLRRLQQESSRLIVVQEEVEQGMAPFPSAFNQGIRLASAPRVGFLLSDDWLDPTAVEECLRLDADIVCTGLTCYEADGRTVLPRISKTLTEEGFRAKPTLQGKANYLEHFFLFRKTKLFEVGGIDETMGDSGGIDDYDLIWTLLEADASVRIVEKSLYNKREHDGVRLTMRHKQVRTANVAKILDKHGVTGRRKRRLLRDHSFWFSRPVQVAQAELDNRNFKRLRAILDRILYGPPE